MSDKEIKRDYNLKKKIIKLRFKRKKAKLKADKKDKMELFYIENEDKRPKDPPKRPLLQEIGNSITHGVGSVFAIVSLVLMLVNSETAMERVAACIYFAGMFAMFTASCLYHSFKHGSLIKRLFRRFDYSGIYLMIGATFAPALLVHFGNTFGIVFFIIQWSVIAAGISLVAVFGPSRLRFIHIPLYVVLGWSALMLLPGMMDGRFEMAMWILAGGIVYSVGIIPYIIKYKASHFIWHFFVLLGALTQWIGIFVYLYLG